jgi:hypothetical protein
MNTDYRWMLVRACLEWARPLLESRAGRAGPGRYAAHSGPSRAHFGADSAMPLTGVDFLTLQ